MCPQCGLVDARKPSQTDHVDQSAKQADGARDLKHRRPCLDDTQDQQEQVDLSACGQAVLAHHRPDHPTHLESKTLQAAPLSLSGCHDFERDAG
jgi:hypothetical protein